MLFSSYEGLEVYNATTSAGCCAYCVGGCETFVYGASYKGSNCAVSPHPPRLSRKKDGVTSGSYGAGPSPSPSPSSALSMPQFFESGMVLQAARAGKETARARVYGFAPAGDEVTVSVVEDPDGATETYSATADADGTFDVLLKPHAPTPKTSVNVTVSCGNETVVATDVLFGDLWWCGGQSNMCVPTTAVYDSGPALAKLDAYPNVRYFQALAGLWEPGFAGTATTAARDVPAGGHWKTIADARGGAATCWSTSGVGHT